MAKPSILEPFTAKAPQISCPFCGHWATSIDDIVFNDQDSESMMFFVRCTRCEASGPYEATKEDAMRSWNNRVETITAEFGPKIYR